MTAQEALAAVVAGEDAAIYAYSVAGARVAGRGRRKALTALDSHRSHRDRAASLVTAGGGTPPGSAVAYTLPEPVDSPAAARRLMARVENSLVGLYADAAATLTGAERHWAVRSAVESATRAVTWGAEPQAFPSSPAPVVPSAAPSVAGSGSPTAVTPSVPPATGSASAQ